MLALVCFAVVCVLLCALAVRWAHNQRIDDALDAILRADGYRRSVGQPAVSRVCGEGGPEWVLCASLVAGIALFVIVIAL